MQVGRAARALLIALGLAMACSPNGPSPVPAFISRTAIRNVEVTGPDAVPPGESAQFRLVAHQSDGPGRDVTSEARWSSERGRVSVSSQGVVSGVERGEDLIEARFEGYYGSKAVLVLPAGTYRLAGQVSEAGAQNGEILGARVEVTAGSGAGLVTLTDSEGRFGLYGVSGQTGLRVTKEGYEAASPSVFVGSHQTLQIELPVLGGRPDLSGTYTLTVVAADSCGVGVGEGRLPPEARVRTYKAVVVQEARGVSVTLSGATVRGGGPAVLSGAFEPGRVVFGNFLWLEPLANSQVLQIAAHDYVTTDTPARLEGTFEGSFSLYEGEPGPSFIAGCASEGHRFVFRR